MLFDRDPIFPTSARTAAMNAQAGDLPIMPLDPTPPVGPKMTVGTIEPVEKPSSAAAVVGLGVVLGLLVWWRS